MKEAMTGTAKSNDEEPVSLPPARQRPFASRSLQYDDQQMHAEEGQFKPGLKMEMAFALSLELGNLFRAGLRSRGLQEPEIERLFNSLRR